MKKAEEKIKELKEELSKQGFDSDYVTAYIRGFNHGHGYGLRDKKAYAEQAIDECLTFYVPDGNSQVWRDKILQVKKEL